MGWEREFSRQREKGGKKRTGEREMLQFETNLLMGEKTKPVRRLRGRGSQQGEKKGGSKKKKR